MTDESDTTPEQFDLYWARGIPVETVTRWNDTWDEDVWEEALLHHARITDLIYTELMRDQQTSTGYVPAWVRLAAQAVVREYMCRSCGYGLVDLGCYGNACNDCRPRLSAAGEL